MGDGQSYKMVQTALLVFFMPMILSNIAILLEIWRNWSSSIFIGSLHFLEQVRYLFFLHEILWFFFTLVCSIEKIGFFFNLSVFFSLLNILTYY